MRFIRRHVLLVDFLVALFISAVVTVLAAGKLQEGNWEVIELFLMALMLLSALLLVGITVVTGRVEGLVEGSPGFFRLLSGYMPFEGMSRTFIEAKVACAALSIGAGLAYVAVEGYPLPSLAAVFTLGFIAAARILRSIWIILHVMELREVAKIWNERFN